MKSKKKMLLALGAMSAAAIGAGATSTFAWYSASSAATATAAMQGATVTTTMASAADGTDVVVQFTFTSTTHPELSDSAGVCYYLVNGVKTKRTAGNPVGQYSISVAMSADDIAIWAADEAHDETETYTVRLASTNDRIKLLDNGTGATDESDVVSYHTITFTISAAGAVATSHTGYYAVRGIEDANLESAGKQAEDKSALETLLSDEDNFTLTNLAKSDS